MKPLVLSTPRTAAARRARLQQHQHQRGVVLIISLILLVILTMTSVMAIRNSLGGEQLSNNFKAQQLAQQAAELALRYCEREFTAGTLSVSAGLSAAADPQAWKTASNWDRAATAVANVPLDVVNGGQTGENRLYRNAATAPQCLFEDRVVRLLPGAGSAGGGVTAMLQITVRGYSPDYARGSGGMTTSGADVWLQSVIPY